MPDAKDTQIAELEKRNARLEKLSKLNDAQRAHHALLPSDEGDAFLAKSSSERAAIVADIEKANEVVYTSTTTGKAFRKSDDPRLVEMAKMMDEQSGQLAKATLDAEQAKLEKRAETELAHFAKGANVRAAILKAIDGIKDEAIRKEAHESLKAADAALKAATLATGVNPQDALGGGASDAKQVYKTELAEFAKSVKKTEVQATSEFIRTPRGAELYANAYPRNPN